MKKWLLPFYFIPCLPGMARQAHYTPGSWYTGPGAYNHHFTQAFAFPANQAALANCTLAGASVFAEKKFGLKELSAYKATVALPVKRGGIGVALQYAGYTEFNESQVALAYGKQLGRVSLGIQCNYNMVRMAGYGNDAAIGVEIGALWHIGNRLFTGVHMINPTGGRFNNHQSEKLAAVYEWGAGYKVSDRLFMGAIIGKTENQPLQVQAALQYAAVERLFINLGITTATATPYAGVGWQWAHYRVHITARYHPQLGLSPGLLLIFYGKATAAE